VSVAYLAPARPRVFGHRGAAALAPENTLPSFALARALGAEYLELDVHATSDGVVVVLHDEDLQRTTNGKGPIAAHTWAAVAQLDAGHHFSTDGIGTPYRGQGTRIPTLEAVLDSFPDSYFNIEIKQRQPPIVERVAAIVRNCKKGDRVLLAAEHDDVMESIRRTVGTSIATGTATGEVADFIGRVESGDWKNYRPPGVALQIPPTFGGRDLVTHESVDAAHQLGVEIHVWTINEPAEIERLLDLGVDGIMSDAPGLVRTAIDRLGPLG
jgi:glycerophosphoryl diester phosphodiesterase